MSSDVILRMISAELLSASHTDKHTHTQTYVHKSFSLSHTHTSTLIFCFLNLKPAEKKMDSGNHSSLTEFILTGLTEKPQFQLPIFPSLPKNLYGHWDGEPGHDHTDWGQFSPAHPHVLFPQLFVLYWSLSVHCHYPQMLVNSVREKNISYPECMTQLYCVCWNDIWRLCCHL